MQEPDIAQQQLMLQHAAETEVFCSSCNRALTPSNSVLVCQYIDDGRQQVSSIVFCCDCFDQSAAPYIKEAGGDPSSTLSIAKVGVHVLVIDGRRLSHA